MWQRRSCGLGMAVVAVAVVAGACDSAPRGGSGIAGEATAQEESPLAVARGSVPVDTLLMVDWLLENNEIHDDKVDFGVHEVDIEWDYLGVVFSVSPGSSMGYSGALWPSEDIAVIDSGGNVLTPLVWQTWTLYGDTTIGSVSFEPISDTVGSARLVIPHFEREDGREIAGPWELEFLRLEGFDPAEPRYVHGAVFSMLPVAHSAESVVYIDSGFWEYDPEAITPTPEDTEEVVEGTPEWSGTPGPTALPMPTLELAPNAHRPFTLKASSTGALPARFIHAAMELSTGAYWYDFVDEAAQ